MLTEKLKAALTSNQIAVVIGARGTGKSLCADELTRDWEALGIDVLRIDASKARFPEDLNVPLAAALACDGSRLTAEELGDDRVVRVVVEKCDRLFDQAWVGEWQERWRALFTDRAAEGRLAAVLFGRPLFRQIAGGDSSPLLNAARVLPVEPLGVPEIESLHGLDERTANAVRRKTGGHRDLTAMLTQELAESKNDFRTAMKRLVDARRSYIAQLVQDQSLGGRSLLGELLLGTGSVHESALIQRHFGSAHADGLEAIEDLRGSGLIERSEAGDCTVAAALLRKVEGLREVAAAPEMSMPSHEAEVMDACWRALFRSENELRMLVAERLRTVDPVWWVSDVPPEVRGAAEGRKRREGTIAATEEPQSHPLMYLTLDELFSLIFCNWDRVFRAVFAPLSQETVEGLAQKFAAIRNRLAHSRPVSADQLQEFETLLRRLGLGES